jgi:pyridoxamine 5'-phosphate oxidase
MINTFKKWLKKHDAATWRTAVSAVRRDYTGKPLTEEHAGDAPFVLFEEWFEDIVKLSKFDPNAMVLSTSKEGQPSGRVVLLKGFDERGFVFFTNYESAKAEVLNLNPKASLTFNWPETFRQVRIEGIAEKVSEAESEAYFLSRPKESNFSAIASPQSRIIESRNELEKLLQETKNMWKDKEQVERPAYWGGYRIKPQKIEFWQGRVNRLHDRIIFERKDTKWIRYRLAP